MPSHIKAMLCVVVALVAVAFFFYERGADRPNLGWIALGLAAFMIVALWIFPEAKKTKDDLQQSGPP